MVIFSVFEMQLHVLLVQRSNEPGEPFPGLWALPGGFVDISRDADLEACARRKLRDKTGVDPSYLEQLGSWGSAKRDPRGWSATHVYFALMSADTPSCAPVATRAIPAGLPWKGRGFGRASRLITPSF